ncbi:YceI family protein [Leadbetterella byssophila]|uniref:YceI family protein n=1 Tax=Leadbetterella byssophila TaxID=316068 RepID=UPI00399FAE30
MMKCGLILGVLWVVCLPLWGQTLTCKSAQVSFFSSAPMEDIEAKSLTAVAALNASTGDVVFKVKNTSFQFAKKLMREHFNENYMESEKFPISEFRGKLADASILQKPGKYTVPVTGSLQVHGVTKVYEVKVDLTVEEGAIQSHASFPVKVADHNIKIPALLGKNIAETVKITIKARFTP